MTTYPHVNGVASTTGTTVSYSYNTANPDRLTRVGSNSIAYNSMGCIASYNSRNYRWERGKLAGYTRGSMSQPGSPYENCTYTYNALGQRVSKSFSFLPSLDDSGATLVSRMLSSNRSYYYDHSGRLVSEKFVDNYESGTTDNTEITYLYDESSMIGLVFNRNGSESVYYYHRNLQGDVVGIYDTNGTKVVEYAYDAWGNCSTTSATTNYVLAYANPIRYRGYYFDVETSWYFLNARYYNPEWRRFISPDSTSYIDPQNVNGLNVYCYCNNDPVNYADPSGHFPVLAVILGITAVVGFGLSVGGVAADDNFLTAVGLTMVAIPALIAGGLAAFASTGALAIGVGIVTMIAGGFTGVFAGAEYQEAFTGQNFILNTGISDELYNSLMLTTAGIATLGTFASSFAYHFNINSIDKIGTLEGTNYKGIRFTQKVQRAGGRQVKLYRTLEWHTHSHLGYNPHWQLNKFSYYNEMWNRSDAIARWTWWLTQIVG